MIKSNIKVFSVAKKIAEKVCTDCRKVFSDVISLYKQMGLVGIKDDHFTLSIMINCFCHLNQMHSSLSVLGKFVKSGNEPNTVALNNILKGFLLQEKVNEAAEFYGKMTRGDRKPYIITYTTLLNGFGKLGNTTAAIQLLRNMEKHSSCTPVIVAYNTVVHGLCKDGLVAYALNLFSKMTNKGVAPNVVTYTSLIHRASMLSQSKETAIIS